MRKIDVAVDKTDVAISVSCSLSLSREIEFAGVFAFDNEYA